MTDLDTPLLNEIQHQVILELEKIFLVILQNFENDRHAKDHLKEVSVCKLSINNIDNNFSREVVKSFLINLSSLSMNYCLYYIRRIMQIFQNFNVPIFLDIRDSYHQDLAKFRT